MANYAYERLSAHDASFLIFENPNTHMHISWTWIFETGPLARADGGVDIQRIRRHVAARLYRFPRFRQRIMYTPLERHPVWVDDENFKLHYHVRHASLTEPGNDTRLKTTTSSIISQPLDRSKPLWEMWIVEGLSDGRFAIVTKTHHCMVDGVATIDLMTGLLDRSENEPADEPSDWIPRPAPTATDLFRASLVDRLSLGLAVSRRVGETLKQLPNSSRFELSDRLNTLRGTLASGLATAPETPFNRSVGPHRYVNWTQLDLGKVRTIAHRHGATERDVILATVAGALSRLLERDGFDLGKQPLRIVVPASTRGDTEPGTLGNRAAGWIIPLPVGERDAARRFRSIRRTTAGLRSSNQALGLDLLLQLAEIGGNLALHIGVGLSRRLHPYNLIVTTISGPREPRYLLGARMVEAYPQVPLFENQGLGIAVASYLDQLDIGVTSDWEILPDLRGFIADIQASFDELAKLKPAAGAAKARRPRATVAAKSKRRAHAEERDAKPKDPAARDAQSGPDGVA